jgi:hypothetical protein
VWVDRSSVVGGSDGHGCFGDIDGSTKLLQQVVLLIVVIEHDGGLGEGEVIGDDRGLGGGSSSGARIDRRENAERRVKEL